ncbi:MAG: 3'-5' exonuclease domain-containing protein 2 [Bacteroidales bacterium]|nr:3'-5' exonuclease domain-containing protein 2 [Bacteroidales bacterium]
MAYSSNITHEELDILPQASFDGDIHVIDTLGEEYDKAISYLSSQRIIGFDTETKPTFQANVKRNGVSLLQLAGRDQAFIFRLIKLGLTEDLCGILGSKRIAKIGAAVHDDIRGLQRLAKFTPRGFVDLQVIGSNWGIKEKSVRKMAAIILGIKVSKSQQLSNWEADMLSHAQVLYAATDAWVCQRMYLKLLSTPKLAVAEQENGTEL